MWPDRVTRSFAKVLPNAANDSAYYGPYNKLLTHLFPLDGERDYTICPQFNVSPSKDSAETVLTFEVALDSKPVFILEIKTPAFLDRKSTRAWADEQVRSCLVYHYGVSPCLSLIFLRLTDRVCRGMPNSPSSRRQRSRYKVMFLHVRP
jgi:hypothetical protein